MNTLVFLVGEKGAGKTRLLRSLVARALYRHPGFRAVVWDSMNEWQCPRGVLHPERLTILSPLECDANDAARLAMDVSQEHGGCVLVVDEVDSVLHSSYPLLPEVKGGQPLHTVIHYGRHKNVALWCAARRVANVHTDVTTQANVVYVFRTTHPRDLKRIAEFAGGGPAAALRAPTLDAAAGEFIRIDP